MGSSTAMLALCFLPLLGYTIDARKDPGEYWRAMMKDQPMPEAIQALLPSDPPLLSKERTESYHLSAEEETFNPRSVPFNEEFQHRPSATASVSGGDGSLKTKKPYTENFEPRPSATAYVSGGNTSRKTKKPYTENFEPRPGISAYVSSGIGGLKEEKLHAGDFKPRQTPWTSV